MCRPENYPPYDTAYPSTPTGEHDPDEWTPPDEMTLAKQYREDMEADLGRDVSWGEVQQSLKARAKSARTFTERLHDALVLDPRGCEHPRAMKPQCERIAAHLDKEDTHV